MFSFPSTVQTRMFQLVGFVRYILLERHFVHTIRVGIVLITLALTTLTALIVMNKGVIGLALPLAFASLIAFVFFYHNLEYSAFVLIFVSTVIDPTLPRDLTLTLILTIILLSMWIGKLVIADRFLSIQPKPVALLAIAFAIIVAFTFIWSTYFAEPEVQWLFADKILPRLLTGIVLIISPFVTLFFANNLRSLKIMKLIVWQFILVGAILGFMEILKLPVPEIINHGGQFPVWVSLLALGQALFNNKLRWSVRIGLLVIVAGWLYITFGLGVTWLSGWVPLIGGVAIVAFLRSRKLFICLILICVIFVAANLDSFGAVFEAENQESGVTRAGAANLAMDVFNEHMLFGTGPAGYYFYITAERGRELFQLSHNNYVDILSQTGVFGFIIYFGFWLAVGWIVLKLFLLIRVFRQSSDSGYKHGMAISLIAMYPVTLVAGMLGDWVTPFTYTQTLRGFSYTIWHWVFVGMALALYYHGKMLTDEEYPKH